AAPPTAPRPAALSVVFGSLSSFFFLSFGRFAPGPPLFNIPGGAVNGADPEPPAPGCAPCGICGWPPLNALGFIIALGFTSLDSSVSGKGAEEPGSLPGPLPGPPGDVPGPAALGFRPSLGTEPGSDSMGLS